MDGAEAKTKSSKEPRGKVPPPANLEAEQAVLGAMLLTPEALAQGLSLLQPEDFHFDTHHRIFRTIRDLHILGRPIDLITITEDLRKTGYLQDVGGATYISQLLTCIPTTGHLETHAAIVREAADRRELARIGSILQDGAAKGDPARLLETVRARLERVESRPTGEAEEDPFEDAWSPNKQYRARRGSFFWDRPDGQLVQLSNFGARIVEEIVEDDGSGEPPQRFFVLEGRLADGRKLPSARVLDAQFSTMNWPMLAWGHRVQIGAGAGKKEHLRLAIQQFSPAEASETRVFSHLGWRKQEEGGYVFLHARGAVGAEGEAASGVRVNIDGELGRYDLGGEEGTREEEDAALRTSLSFLDLGNEQALFPLFAAVWRAVLCEWAHFPAVVWVMGPSGAMKTSTTAVALAHFGPFREDVMPANWLDSANRLEQKTFIAKDCLFAVDDFHPESDPGRQRDMEEKASRLVFAVGNRQGRGRLRLDHGRLAGRRNYLPRCLVVTSAEHLPNLPQSGLARLFPVPFRVSSVDKERLTKLQASVSVLPLATRAYLRYLSTLANGIEKEMEARFRVLRDQAAVEGHNRLPGLVAHLYQGMEYFVNFLMERKILKDGEADYLCRTSWGVFSELAKDHGRLLGEERASQVYLDTLREALAGGACFLRARDTNQVLGEPGRTAVMIGWADAEGTYLLAGETFRFASERLRYRGGLSLKERALHEMLEQEGVITKKASGRLTITVWMPGSGESFRVLWLKPGILGAGKSIPPPGEEAEPPPAEKDFSQGEFPDRFSSSDDEA
jgi:hypothetical protein